MWVFTDNGFYSVVAFDPAKAKFEFDESRVARRGVPDDDPGGDLVLVRGRDELDMLRLAARFGCEIVETPDGDYLYRTILTKNEWIDFLGTVVENIDYSNFKNAVTEHQGKKRHDLYMRVWSVMMNLQPFKRSWSHPPKKIWVGCTNTSCDWAGRRMEPRWEAVTIPCPHCGSQVH